MFKSVSIGAISTSIIYFSYGVLCYLMYGDQITDSALKYLQGDMAEAHKNKYTFIVISSNTKNKFFKRAFWIEHAIIENDFTLLIFSNE